MGFWIEVGRQERQPSCRSAISDGQRCFRWELFPWTVKVGEAGGDGDIRNPIVLSMIHDRCRRTAGHLATLLLQNGGAAEGGKDFPD